MPNINPHIKVEIDPLVKVQAEGAEVKKAAAKKEKVGPPAPAKVKKDAAKPKAPKREEPKQEKKKDEGKTTIFGRTFGKSKGKKKGKR